MLEVGKNSYITVEEADNLIERLCLFDKSVPYWQALTDEQKAVLLLESCKEIEYAPKQGNRVYAAQTMEYPRRAQFMRFVDGYYQVPEEIKQAQAVNALKVFSIRLGGVKDGMILSSAQAEKIMRRWLCGGL